MPQSNGGGPTKHIAITTRPTTTSKPAIVTSISRKRARHRRAGYTAAEPDDDPKGDALVQAMARMIRPPE